MNRHLMGTFFAPFFIIAAQAQSAGEVEHIFNTAHEYRALHEQPIIEDFVALLSLPNVATNLIDIHQNADHITKLLETRGFTTQRLTAGGAPYIYAELQTAEANETIMIYAHYDGQPVLEENWEYPPFSPTMLNASLKNRGRPVKWRSSEGPLDPEWRLYGRSTGDDKMPIIALIHALDALDANDIPLSVNLKLLLDGEEEQGSPTVGGILEAHSSLFESDLLLFCDGPMHQSRRAQLVFGVRGDTGVDITAYGATRPLHSGHYGNWAPNPIMELSYLLTRLRDETGRISIEGYYDDVVPLSSLERT
ncbi:MAG: M20/M25/M40 family metallo-hydrolase, partial [Gammaproteobacteria bacterium]